MFVCYLSHMILITLLSLENVADSRSVVVGTCYKMFSWLKQPLRPAAALTLNIEVDDQRTFTTRERITGRLTIKPVVDTPLDKLEIKLQGISRAYGRRIVPHAPNARTVTTAHRFLELTQPDLAHCSPEDKVFRSGRQYIFPFEFVIPDRMLPATCRHAVESMSFTRQCLLPLEISNQAKQLTMPHARRQLNIASSHEHTSQESLLGTARKFCSRVVRSAFDSYHRT
jgi:hypothetical protein